MAATSSKSYRVGPGPRAVNRIFSWLAKKDRGPETLHVLTTRGRRSGEARAVPVHVIEHDGTRWIVAIYGTQGWVRNVMETSAVTLRRGSRVEHAALKQAEDDIAERVIVRYAEHVPHVRPYLHDEDGHIDHTRLASTHPVFEVVHVEEALPVDGAP